MIGGNGVTKGGLKGIHILMVDSDMSTRTIIGGTLRDAGCQEFMQTGDGKRALELIQTRQVDVVLMDCMVATGGGFLRALRLTGIGKAMPVIIITSSDDGEKAWVARNLKVAAWLAKPCQSATIIAQIAGVLKRGTQQPETAVMGTLADAYEKRLPIGLQNLTTIATRVHTGHRGFGDCAEETLTLLLQLRGMASVLGHKLIAEFTMVLHHLQHLAVLHPVTTASVQPELTRMLRIVPAAMLALQGNKQEAMPAPVVQFISEQLRTPLLDLKARFEDSIRNAELQRHALQDAMAVRKAEVETETWRLRRTIIGDDSHASTVDARKGDEPHLANRTAGARAHYDSIIKRIQAWKA